PWNEEIPVSCHVRECDMVSRWQVETPRDAYQVDETKYKTSKRIIETRGVEEIHTEQVHEQFGPAAISGRLISSRDFIQVSFSRHSISLPLVNGIKMVLLIHYIHSLLLRSSARRLLIVVGEEPEEFACPSRRSSLV
ncbi:hypothetical protein PMAYCL1PPCAC_04190, partial [Pristionchus mayeri]